MTRSHWLMMAGFGLLLVALAAGSVDPTYAQSTAPPDDLIERGEYLTTLAGCIDCHTPRTDEDEMITERALAGGRPFDIGELGTVLAPNITQDEETGIGTWTDEEIKVAIKTGVSPDGHHSFPVMPYPAYAGMAEEDLDAIVAYLRTVAPIENQVPQEQVLPPEALPQVPYVVVESAPDPGDVTARGDYLINNVFACGDCHTPQDPATGLAIEEEYLSGGRPFEGPWGVVYAANITPHTETGIGSWSQEQIRASIKEGVRPDGRVLILMPADEVYSVMTDDDLDAVVSYLSETVPPVPNEVPAPALEEDFIRFEQAPPAQNEPEANNTLLILGGVLLVVLAGGAGVIMGQRAARRDDD